MNKKKVLKIAGEFAKRTVDNSRVIADPSCTITEKLQASVRQAINERIAVLSLSQLNNVKNLESGGMVSHYNSIEPDVRERITPNSGGVNITIDAKLTTDLHNKIADYLHT